MSRVNQPAYEAVISQLNTTAAKIEETVGILADGVNKLAGTLGEEDSAIGPIQTKVAESQGKYEEAVAEARRIAAAMQEELERALQEENVWSGEE